MTRKIIFSLLLAVNIACLPAAQAQQLLSSQPQKASKNMEIPNEDLEFEKNKTTLQQMISFPNNKIKAINLLATEMLLASDLKLYREGLAYYKQENVPVGWKAAANGMAATGWFRIENEKIYSVFDRVKNIYVSPRDNMDYIEVREIIEIEYFDRKPIQIIINGKTRKTNYLAAEIDGISDKSIPILILLKDIQNLFYSIDNSHVLFNYYN